MSAVGEEFGPPDPAGGGWYRDGFLYLSGEGLEELRPCLDAWSFLVPSGGDRTVLGRNAYGALIVEGPGPDSVWILDPFTVSYTRVAVDALPPGFLDGSAYRGWLDQHGLDGIEFRDVLGIKVPKGLGGALEVDNLQIEDIVDYYESTGPIYADAFATLLP